MPGEEFRITEWGGGSKEGRRLEGVKRRREEKRLEGVKRRREVGQEKEMEREGREGG